MRSLDKENPLSGVPNKNCIVCNKIFYNARFDKRGHRISRYTKIMWERAKFCSHNCRHVYMKGKPSSRLGTSKFTPKNCKICGKEFKKGGRTIEQWEIAHFCSVICLSKSKIGVPRPDMIGRLAKVRKHHKGSSHWNWKGGITDFTHSLRRSQEYLVWRNTVYKRDYWTCQKCQKKCRKEDIVAHHLLSFKDHELVRFEVNNGITLCRSCHKKTHYEIGYTTRFTKK